MMKKIKYIYSGLLALALLSFIGCQEKSGEPDEWTDTAYVYVKGQSLGNEFKRTVNVNEKNGLVDPAITAYKFHVCINRAVKSDVVVALEAVTTGYMTDIAEKTVVLSGKSVTIPAGKLTSEEVILNFDPAFMDKQRTQGAYDPTVVVVKLAGVSSKSEAVKASTKTDRVKLTFAKVVVPYLNIVDGALTNVVALDRANWTGTLGPGVENVFANIIDGKNTDIATTAPWYFTVDVGAVVEMLSFKTTFYSSSYSPTRIEILSSTDNENWSSQGIYTAKRASNQNWHFIEPVSARYIKYMLLLPLSRLSVTELNIYVANPTPPPAPSK